ncbi:hypothetical protein BZG36_00901 [Bifiguratus adelaidae]|uniref:Flavoprotein domain-containing protein n=1 Tax=Bifiguratus adelaidae TaxID=1938954 RepID=A0A261Y5C4_9FUNG|nr:hypothetical protein BZG36_00901 [Bifiguratus adelaidae]
MDIVLSPRAKDDETVHILLAATGSVASIKVPDIVTLLYKASMGLPGAHCRLADHFAQIPNVTVKVMVTRAALHFFSPKDIVPAQLYTDEDEWRNWNKRDDPILHIELRRWADIVVVAPLDANTLAKIANGLCDNLTSTLRALPPVQPIPHDIPPSPSTDTAMRSSPNPRLVNLPVNSGRGDQHTVCTTPVIVAPAMNTYMYTHPFTTQHLNTLRSVLGYSVIGPIEKTLACGDIGHGAMSEPASIVQAIEDIINLPNFVGGSWPSAGDDEES